jgi:RNA polymerase sigma-70 factor (ECF subfamily)
MLPSKLQSVLDLPLPTTVSEDDSASSHAVQDEVLRVFDECAPSLRRYVSSFRLGAESTEDVVQEVFLALFRHLRLGRPGSNLTGWLFQVGHNLALKQRHKMRRLQVGSADEGPLAERLIDPAANPEERLAEYQRRQRLRSVLRAMPERDRRCFYLRAEGLRYREIAATLGISLGSVAKSVTRAIVRLANADER